MKVTLDRLKVMDIKAGQALKYQIYQKVKQLTQQRHEISVSWIPDHSNIERNKRANMAAKEVAGDQKI